MYLLINIPWQRENAVRVACLMPVNTNTLSFTRGPTLTLQSRASSGTPTISTSSLSQIEYAGSYQVNPFVPKISFFTTIGSNWNLIGKFAVVDMSTDNATSVNVSRNGHTLKELFYLTLILWLQLVSPHYTL